MKNIEAAIYDLDGTIADSLDLAVKIYDDARSHIPNLPKVEESRHSELREMRAYDAIKALEVSPKQLKQVRAFAREQFIVRAGEVRPFEGMDELVNRRLGNSALKQGIVTSAPLEYVNTFIDNFIRPESIDTLVAEARIFSKKRSLGSAIKDLAISAERAVYVGDQQRDVSSARKVGMISIGVTWGVSGRRGIEKAKPDFIVDSTDELSSVIDDLQNRS